MGFNALTLVLPQAIAGVLSVALLYHLVRRTFGPIAGLLSALALAVTPIIVTSRYNTTIRVPMHMTEKIRKVSRASGELSVELG